MSARYCTHCGRLYDPSERHTCFREFDVIFPEHGETWNNTDRPVEAYDHEEAAERAVARFNEAMAEYNSLTIAHVRQMGSEDVQVYEVAMEAVPRYQATRKLDAEVAS